MKLTLLLGLLSLSVIALPSDANVPDTQSEQPASAAQFDRSNALTISQAAIGRKVDDHHFTTSQDVPRAISEYLGKPLVISLIYTSCYHICPTTTQHLAKVVRKARSALGDDSFSVLTIGFDTANDNTNAMRIFAAQQSIAIDGWDFLSADQATIEALSQDLGFQYFSSPSGFDHLIQSTIIDAEGSVFRQIYGIEFDTPHLIEPLKVLVFGVDSQDTLFDQITTRILLFCTVYDPASDSYKFDYSIFIGLFMGLTLGGVFIYLVIREWRFSKSRQRHSDVPGTADV
jgi:protein SCO1/2